MKKLFQIGAILFIASQVSGQSLEIPFDTLVQLCPPDSSYLYAEASEMSTSSYSITQETYYTEPVGGTTVSMWDDQVLGPYSIGFDFDYFCNTYSQFYIGSNGWVGFSSGQTTTWVIQSIPTTNANTPKNCAMAPWRDWNPGVGSGPYITYQTLGSAPCRRLVVTWSSVPMFSCTSTYGTFQLVFHESTNIIDMNQTNVPTCLGWGNGDGTQGLHNSNGTTAVVVTGRNDSQFTCTNETWRFNPTSAIIWTNQSGSVVDTGNCITVSPITSTWYYASGTDCSGNPYVDSVLVAVSCIGLEVDSIDVTCTGDSSGVLLARDTSVVTQAPLTFYWYNSSGNIIATHVSNDSLDTLLNMPAGNYSVLVFDDLGNVASGQTIINEPPVKTAFTNSVDVLCQGEGTGIAMAMDTNQYTLAQLAANGNSYSFTWADAANNVISSSLFLGTTTDSLFNLTAGTYNVTIDGCFQSLGSVVVDEPDLLTTTIINATQTSCPGYFCDANATGAPIGGVMPYYYQWTSGEGSAQATSLCPGENFVTVTDANGCDTFASVVIIAPDSIVTDAFGDTLICITNPAAIVTSSTGGTPPYSYIWTIDSLDGDTVLTSFFGSVYPVVTKEYFVTSTDANGCIGDTANVLIKVRPPLDVAISHVDTICPYDTIEVEAFGIGGDSIYSYTWGNGAFGPTTDISPDLPGWFTVTVTDQCGTPEYTDSVWVQVGGYSDILAEIRVEEDSVCVGESVYLIASGRGGFKGPDEYRFSWNNASWDGNPVQFVLPLKTTEYIVTITDLCLSVPASDTVTIYVGQPDLPEVSATPTVACSYASVTISIDSLKEHYEYNWILGDGNEVLNAQSKIIEHKYESPGCYDVKLSVVTDFGCPAEKTFPCFIEVLQSPTADFVNTPDQPTTLEPFVQFRDASDSAESIEWFLEGSPWGSATLFNHEFTDTGEYLVQLVAISEDGCKDTISKVLRNNLVVTLHIPSAFSPNGDGLNDVFTIVGEGVSLEEFEMEIYDRWGRTVFYSRNPHHGWDGKMIVDGQMAPIGSYAYMIKYIDRYGEPKKLSGQVMISTSHEGGGIN